MWVVTERGPCVTLARAGDWRWHSVCVLRCPVTSCQLPCHLQVKKLNGQTDKEKSNLENLKFFNLNQTRMTVIIVAFSWLLMFTLQCLIVSGQYKYGRVWSEGVISPAPQHPSSQAFIICQSVICISLPSSCHCHHNVYPSFSENLSWVNGKSFAPWRDQIGRVHSAKDMIYRNILCKHSSEVSNVSPI